MANLWEETMRMLVAHGKTFENVEYVEVKFWNYKRKF